LVAPYRFTETKYFEMDDQIELPSSSRAKPLTSRQRKAAQLVFDDLLTDDQIAAEIGVSRRSISAWRKRDDFNAELTALHQEYSHRVMSRGIAVRARRVEKLNELHDKSWQVIAERGGDPTMQRVPGGQTGLIIRGFANVRDPSTGQWRGTAEYEVDTGLMAEIRNIQKQVATELGQLPNETPVGVTNVTVNQSAYVVAIRHALGLATVAPQEAPATIEIAGVDAADILPAGVEE
jgi:Helix-turn-helix of insertion element transposase